MQNRRIEDFEKSLVVLEKFVEDCQNNNNCKIEKKNISDISLVTIGEFVRKDKQNENGLYPVYNGGISNTGYYDEFNMTKNKIIMSARGANAGFVNKVETDYWAGNSCYSIEVIDENVNWNYLFYVMKNSERLFISNQQTASIPSVSKKQVETFEVYIPPIDVQNAIVNILDTFYNYSNQMTGILPKEIEKRKLQYEYYRNSLLNFKDIAEVQKALKALFAPNGCNLADLVVLEMRVGDICSKVTSGGTPSTSHKDYYDGEIPWLRTQEVDWCDIYDTGVKITQKGLENSSAKWISENCVIVAMYGATSAKVGINKIPLTTNQACCNLEINSNIAEYKYVYYWLCNEYENLRALGQGSQSNINAQIIKNYPILVPSLEVQKIIVFALDNYYTLCNSLTSGLPKEIELVGKQYNYYRNKLLSFKEKKL